MGGSGAKKRWPWDFVRGFKCESLADGRMMVTPDWDPKRVRPHSEEFGGGPGLGMRLGMAQWINNRLKKRGTR